MAIDALKVEWVDAGREPTQQPDPAYPDGIDIDATTQGQKRTCRTDLPYPARRCGHYLITCRVCGMTAMVTTAGRRDDPRSIKVPCKVYPA